MYQDAVCLGGVHVDVDRMRRNMIVLNEVGEEDV